MYIRIKYIYWKPTVADFEVSIAVLAAKMSGDEYEDMTDANGDPVKYRTRNSLNKSEKLKMMIPGKSIWSNAARV